MKVLIRLILFLNICLILATVLGYLASYIDPSSFSLPQVAGLFMPWLLGLNLIFILFWGSLRKKWIFLSALTIFLGLGQISRFIGWHFDQEVSNPSLSICTFNSESYNRSNHLEKFAETIKAMDPIQVFCLQEISSDRIEELRRHIDLPNMYTHRGKVILSQFPIVRQGNLQFDQTVNGCIWVDLDVGGSEVRIYNVHLHSNQVSRDAETIIENINTDKAQAITKIRHMVGNYKRATIERSKQVQKILSHIKTTDHPVILAGDLNDTPFSYTYQQFKATLLDQFRAAGLGIGTTYAGELPGLKIDYIFADNHFESQSHQILKTKISDHFPLLSYMKLKN